MSDEVSIERNYPFPVLSVSSDPVGRNMNKLNVKTNEITDMLNRYINAIIVTLNRSTEYADFKVAKNDGSWNCSYASNQTSGDDQKVIGVIFNSDGTASDKVDIVSYGIITNSLWAWTIGGAIYLSTAGTMSQTPPATGFRLIVGYALSATSMIVGSMNSPLRMPLAVSNFANILSSSDTNLQTAIDTIDDHVISKHSDANFAKTADKLTFWDQSATKFTDLSLASGEGIDASISATTFTVAQTTYFENHDSIIAGAILSANKVIIANDSGQAVVADKDVDGDRSRVLGLTQSSASLGASVKYTISGIHTNDTWTWTMGMPVFLGNTGELTQTVPTTGFLMVIGFPVSATKLNVRIGRAGKLIA